MMIVKVWSWLTYSQKSKVWQMHTKIKLPISWAILTSFFVDNSLKLFEISWSFGIDVSLSFNQPIFNSNQDFVQAKQHRALCSSPGATYVLGRCCTERQNNEPDLVLAADFLNFSFRILPYPSFFPPWLVSQFWTHWHTQSFTKLFSAYFSLACLFCRSKIVH